MTKTLYLMRHGQTRLNVQGRVQGAFDSPLTELGIEQATKARAYFEKMEIHFDLVLSSTQERASDTAELVAGQVPIRYKFLKEMDFGEFEAKEESTFPSFREGATSFEDLLVPFGGEDIRIVGQRVYDGLREVLSQVGEDETILAVSHGAAMWGFILQIGASIPAGVRFGNCAICKLTLSPEEDFVLEAVIDPLSD